MRVGQELREFVLEAWRDRNPALSEPESRKLIAEVKGVSLKAVESILRHVDDGGAPKPREAKPAPATPKATRRKIRRRRQARRTPKSQGPPPITDRESATLLCVAQRLVDGRDDDGSIHLTDRGRHVLGVLERYAP